MFCYLNDVIFNRKGRVYLFWLKKGVTIKFGFKFDAITTDFDHRSEKFQ